MKKTSKFNAIIILIVLFVNHEVVAQDWPGVKDSIYSNDLKEYRDFQVVLPNDYEPSSDSKYEVLYILDGEWYMEQVPFIYNFTVTAGFAPKSIFVLIPNTYHGKNNLRSRDFSPSILEDRPGSGGADTFHSFLKTELIPHIDKNYPSNGRKSLLGSSFGGLFSVYAFVKEPDLFDSFIASDPSLWWDNNYVNKVLKDRVSEFSEVKSTLFIAGLDRTYENIGIKEFDSILKSSKPINSRWKIIPYTNETHYSVQHRAFYDGIRFSHLGYSKNKFAPLYHPQNGISIEGKPFEIIIIGQPSDLRYTIDGSEPSISSEKIKYGDQILVNTPTVLKINSFPNREVYAKKLIGNFKGESSINGIQGLKEPTIAQLQYSIFEGDWKTFPDIKKLKPTHQEIIKKGFDLNGHVVESNSVHLIKGVIEIMEDAYHVFGIDSQNGSKLQIGGQQLINDEGNNSHEQSFIIPLKKGFYTIDLEIFKKKESANIDFRAFYTKGGNPKWWQHRFPILP